MESRFWKACAVTAVVGLFYVGHGLHERDGLPGLVRSARADGIASVAHESAGLSYVVTASPDGKTVYYYGPKRALPGFNTEVFLGSLKAP